MELLEIQFYACVRKELRSNKNLLYFILLTAPFVFFLIPGLLALISTSDSNAFSRISLVLISLYVSGKFVKTVQFFVHRPENIAMLKHFGFTENQIKVRVTKIVFIFSSPFTLSMLSVFWFTPWGLDNEYSLLVYTAFLISCFGWILVSIWSKPYSLMFASFIFGLYLNYSGISFVFSVVFIVVAIGLYTIKYFDIPLFKSIFLTKYFDLYMLNRPFGKHYLQLSLLLITYVACIVDGSFFYGQEIWILLVILNVTVAQLTKVEQVNRAHSNYCDFISTKTDVIWHTNKWKHSIFLVLAVTSLLLLPNQNVSLILSLLFATFLTIYISFYLVKNRNPHSFMYINGIAIILTWVISIYYQ